MKQGDAGLTGWIHQLVTTDSKDHVDRLLRETRVPRLMLWISPKTASNLLTETLAGEITIPKERLQKGDNRPLLQPRDCLLFDGDPLDGLRRPFEIFDEVDARRIAAAVLVDLLPRPFEIFDLTIPRPTAGMAYCLDTDGSLVELSPSDLNRKPSSSPGRPPP